MLASLETCHYRNIFSAQFIPDGTDKRIVSCGMDGSVVITDVARGANSRVNSSAMGNYSHMLYKIAFLPNTPEVFLTTHQDGKVRIFDVRGTNV
jgi:WD repeat-containing protein 42A